MTDSQISVLQKPLQMPIPRGLAIRGDDTDPLVQRAYAESSHAYRTPFARDAARILHSRAFRRLAGKTQVFTQTASRVATSSLSDAGSDHFRSRLTHTLEVTQIARTLAATLGLNVELTEALALVHDIGHPPFGHAGEKALDQALQAHGQRFDHNLHALRIVTWFEERYAAFRGLNLTLAVREGIVKHSRDYSAADHPELAEYFLGEYPPLEAQLIDLADEIAYLTADLDDGFDSGILTLAEVSDGIPLFRRFHDLVVAQFPAAAPRLAVNETLKRILNLLVTDLMNEIRSRVAASGAETLEDLRHANSRLVALSPAVESDRAIAKRFLYENLYNSTGMEESHKHATEVVEGLFKSLIADPSQLPADNQAQIKAQGLARIVADYIAGMTDTYIEQAWMRRTGRRSSAELD